MDPVYVALIATVTTLLGSLSTYLVARTQHTKALTKAVEAALTKAAAPKAVEVTMDRELRAERRDGMAKDLASVLNEWADKTPPKVTRERCDSKHAAIEKQLAQLAGKVDEIADKVGDLGREVSGLAGEVRRINGGSGSGA
jgi:hypothetical protein